MNIILLILLIISSGIFILTFSIALSYACKRIIGKIEAIRKSYAKIKSRKIRLSKQKEIKFRLKLKNAIKKSLKKPKLMLSIAALMAFAILLIVTKSTFFNISIRNIANGLLGIIIVIGMIWVTTKFAKDNSFILKLESLLILAMYAIYLALVPIIVFGNKTINTFSIIFAFMSFFIMVLFTSLIAVRYYYKKMAIAVVSGSYLFILFVGSLAFGEFYYNCFPAELSQYVLEINSTQDVWKQMLIMNKIGIRGFFEFPSPGLLCKASVFQFLIGKIIELVLLGYVATQFQNIENPDNPQNGPPTAC